VVYLLLQYVGGSPESSSAMSNKIYGDTRVYEDGLKKSSTEVWREKDLFFFFSKQAVLQQASSPSASKQSFSKQAILQ
jgi:hypothetical protein